MRQTPGLWIHGAHVALLLIAALDDARDRGSSTQPPARVGGERGSAPAPGVVGLLRSADVAPHCPMPVWRPDPNVRYAAMVIGAHPAAPERRIGAAPCVNSYAHAATPR